MGSARYTGERAGDKPDSGRAGRWIGSPAIIVLLLLFAGGLVHWILFFHGGDIAFNAYDWQKEYRYYSILKAAIGTGVMPYHVTVAFHGTNRFMALPETNLSPQIFLLSFMNVGRFVLVNVSILYSLGFIGCLFIMRRYRLSILSFTLLFLLFNLNGHVTSHLGVGHSMWGAYFLLPFFFLFLLELVEGKAVRTTPIKLAFVLFFIMLQGGLHVYVWSVTFLVLLLIFNWRYLRPIVLSVLFSAILSSFRLIPAGFALADRKERFIWSYPTLRDLIDSLITIRQQTPERLIPWGSVGWWEYDLYVGVIGLAFILWFGVVLRFSRAPDLKHRRYQAFDLPIVIMGTFSLSYFHAFLTRIPLPLLRSERVATRFAVLPLVLLIILAAIRFSDVLRRVKQSIKIKVAAVVGVALITLGFVDHSYLWSVARLERVFRSRTPDLSVPGIITIQDSPYKTILLASAIVSAAGIVFLLYLAFRYRAATRQSN
jgi:hypothetical protein